MFTTIRPKKIKSGFTLLETVVSISLGLLVMMMVLTIFTQGLTQIRNVSNNQSLISNADFIINNLDYWIKKATNISANPSTLTLTLPSSTKTIEMDSNNDILMDGTPLNTDGVKLNSLNFEKMARSVKISFELEKGGQTLLVSTTIAQRN